MEILRMQPSLFLWLCLLAHSCPPARAEGHSTPAGSNLIEAAVRLEVEPSTRNLQDVSSDLDRYSDIVRWRQTQSVDFYSKLHSSSVGGKAPSWGLSKTPAIKDMPVTKAQGWGNGSPFPSTHKGVAAPLNTTVTLNKYTPEHKRVELVHMFLQQGLPAQTGLQIGAVSWPWLLPKGVEVEYVDFMPPQELKKAAPVSDASVHGQAHSSTSLNAQVLEKVPAASTGFILTSHFLEYLSDVPASLKQQCDRLRPGGVLIHQVPHKRCTFDQHYNDCTFDNINNSDIKQFQKANAATAENSMDEEHLSDLEEFGNDLEETDATMVPNQAVYMHYKAWDDKEWTAQVQHWAGWLTKNECPMKMEQVAHDDPSVGSNLWAVMRKLPIQESAQRQAETATTVTDNPTEYTAKLEDAAAVGNLEEHLSIANLKSTALPHNSVHALTYRREDGTCRFTESNLPIFNSLASSLPRLFPDVHSVVDFGGGPGGYLTGFRDAGLTDLVTLEPHDLGSCVVRGVQQLVVDALKEPVERKFDMVMTVEVADHMPPALHPQLIDWLTSHSSKWIVFTAAHPGQPGEGHVANREPLMWREDITRRGGGLWAYDHNMTMAVKKVYHDENDSNYILRTNLHVFRKLHVAGQKDPASELSK